MKPAKGPWACLLGRTVETYRDGLRTAKVVSVPNGHTVTLQFLGTIGRHRQPITSIRAVLWRRKLYHPVQFLLLRTKTQHGPALPFRP